MGKPANKQSKDKQQSERSRGGNRKVTKNMREGGKCPDMAEGGKVKDYAGGGKK